MATSANFLLAHSKFCTKSWPAVRCVYMGCQSAGKDKLTKEGGILDHHPSLPLLISNVVGGAVKVTTQLSKSQLAKR